MPYPSIEEFAVIAAAQDIELVPERLAQAHAGHAAARDQLARLRALPLPFLEPVSEPAHAEAFIATAVRS
jgi:hypothetical protein